MPARNSLRPATDLRISHGLWATARSPVPSRWACGRSAPCAACPLGFSAGLSACVLLHCPCIFKCGDLETGSVYPIQFCISVLIRDISQPHRRHILIHAYCHSSHDESSEWEARYSRTACPEGQSAVWARVHCMVRWIRELRCHFAHVWARFCYGIPWVFAEPSPLASTARFRLGQSVFLGGSGTTLLMSSILLRCANRFLLRACIPTIWVPGP